MLDHFREDWLQVAWEILAAAGWLASFLFAVQVVRRRGSPSATLVWILTFFLLPVVGPLLYLLAGDRRLIRRAMARTRQLGSIPARIYMQRSRALALLPLYNATDLAAIAGNVAFNVSHAPLVSARKLELIHRGDAFFHRLVEDIESARHYVLLEFYRFFSDTTGKRIGAALRRAAKRNVDVYLLYDDIGSYRLSKAFIRQVGAAGVRFQPFADYHWLRRKFHVNFRNHRKLAVIDGRIAYSGGMNVADEVRGKIGRIERRDWRDTQIRLEGEVARLYEMVFRHDWAFSTGKELTLPEPEIRTEPPTDIGIQVLTGGPGDDIEAFHAVLIALLGSARSSVRIGTPYLIPDETVENLLINARARGVQVEIIVPARGNHLLVDLAGKSYYRRLFNSGVRIFEYYAGMYHAKLLTVDDEVSIVGSSNIDQRSFRLNFEINTLISSRRITREINKALDEDISRSREIRYEWFTGRSRWAVLASDLCRIAAPIL